MQILTPEEQGCLEWAYRSATDAMDKHVFILETGQVWARGEQFFLDPGSTFHGWIALLAQAVECHLGGMKPGEQRRNLLAAGVREEAANFVHDHLADVSVVEMADLRQRVQFYRDDKARRDQRSESTFSDGCRVFLKSAFQWVCRRLGPAAEVDPLDGRA